MKFALVLCLVVCLIVSIAGKPQGLLQPEVASVPTVTAGARVSLLASGVWRHGPAERTLISTGSQVTGPGLSTKGAKRAHYATLASENTYSVSVQYCKEHGGELCKASQLCADGAAPVGQDEIPSDIIAYSPVADAPNSWIQLSSKGDTKQCGSVRTPAWGTTATKSSVFTKNLVACCSEAKGILRSYLVPDGILVDPSVGKKLKVAEASAREAVSAMRKMRDDIAAMKTKLGALEASTSTSIKVIHELRDALAMKGSSQLVKSVKDNSGLCCGTTLPGKTAWVQYVSNGIYLDINMAKCGFTRTPAILTSMGGATSHWVTTGATSIYSAAPKSFRVYVQNQGAMTVATANQYQWTINWCARDL